MLEHPEIGWAERTGYPSWMQEKGNPRAHSREDGERLGLPVRYRNGGCEAMNTPGPLKRMEVLLMDRMEQMLAGTNGLKFDSQEFKRNASSLKELRDMNREDSAAQPRQTIAVHLEGEAEGFAL